MVNGAVRYARRDLKAELDRSLQTTFDRVSDVKIDRMANIYRVAWH
jgi:hypothetical protein